MSLKYADRVQETTTTTGTGTYSLLGAVVSFQAFSSALSNGDTCFYGITDGTDWETGRGTYTGSTLARTSVLASSNANVAVNWGAGTKNIWIDFLATAAAPKFAQTTAANPTGTNSTTGKMMGIAGSYTPSKSGVVQFTVQGGIWNNAAPSYGVTFIKYGTGAAPANGDAPTGSQVGPTVQAFNPTTNTGMMFPFSAQGIVTGLILGTTYWFDLEVQAAIAGTASVTGLNLMALEL